MEENIPDRKSARHFLNVWDKKDAEEIEKAIQDGCEQIHPDDWK